MDRKKELLELKSKIWRVWKDGHISCRERDCARAFVDVALYNSDMQMDIDTVRAVVDRIVVWPVSFSSSSLGGVL